MTAQSNVTTGAPAVIPLMSCQAPAAPRSIYPMNETLRENVIIGAFKDVVWSEVYPMTTALCGTISGVDRPGTSNLGKEARSRAPQRRFALFTARLRHRLRYVGAAVASIAAIGAVIGGLTGYWHAWNVVTTESFTKVGVCRNTPPLGPMPCPGSR